MVAGGRFELPTFGLLAQHSWLTSLAVTWAFEMPATPDCHGKAPLPTLARGSALLLLAIPKQPLLGICSYENLALSVEHK